MSHRRYNPLIDEWILCSPGRLRRPWLGEQAGAPEPPPPYDAACYICPGNSRAGGARNPEYDGVFVFDNDFSALSSDDSDPVGTTPLLLSEPVRGRCRVVAFSPRHDLHFGTLRAESIRAVVDVWAEESNRLGRDHPSGYVQVFENRGAMMGASNRHPHGQIWATAHVPTIPAKKAEMQARYWTQQGRDLLGDYLAEELRRSERVIEAGEHWVQLVPFWAVWPFETMVIPTRFVADLTELNEAEREALGALLARLTRRYDAVFETSFPYSMGWYQRPNGSHSYPGSRLHAVYLPPLVRSAAVRKFLVGYELTAEPQRDLTPEEAAERLRACDPDRPDGHA